LNYTLRLPGNIIFLGVIPGEIQDKDTDDDKTRTMQDEDNLRIALLRFGNITNITLDPKMRSATVFFDCDEAAEDALYFFETRKSDVITVTSLFFTIYFAWRT